MLGPQTSAYVRLWPSCLLAPTKWAALCVCHVSGVRRLRLRRIRLNLLSAHFLEGYLVDFDQTSHKYSLGHGAVQA